MKNHRHLLIAAGFLLMASASTTIAQAPSAPSYRPGLGDLMTMTIQPRHIKLAQAGRAQNWSYAAYELHELQEAFDRAATIWPRWQSMPIGEMMKNVTSEPVAALDKAIKAKDSAGYTAAYRQLTEACDTCHQAADRAIIVIRVPEGDMFPDQDFSPPKR